MGDLGIIIIICLALSVLIVIFLTWSLLSDAVKKITKRKGFLEVCLLFFAGAVTYLILCSSGAINTDKNINITRTPETHEIIRNIILALGGIGGLYGLIIARKRLDRFEDQVQMQQD